MTTDLIVGFFTLTALEIVLGIDNLVFISILANKLPEHQQARARKLGIGLALISRLALLGSITLIMQLTEPLFAIGGFEFSGQAIILLIGGLFLIGKATYEIHESLEGEEGHAGSAVRATMGAVLVQIVALDVVFSLDSVITAVGMIGDQPNGIWAMCAAVVIAVIVMLILADPLSRFVTQHPTIKMLALAFLLLIGMTLVADGLGFHVPKGYIYAAMGFSLFVEILNLLRRRSRKPVKLSSRYTEEGEPTGDGGDAADTTASTAAAAGEDADTSVSTTTGTGSGGASEDAEQTAKPAE